MANKKVELEAARRFEKPTDGARKFWCAKRRGKTVWRQWGRVGTDGQSDKKEFADAKTAREAVAGWVQAKLRDDYLEVGAGAAWGPDTPTPSIDEQRRALGELLAQESLSAFEKTLQALARPAVLVDWRRHGDLASGVSKIGGLPDLPKDQPWPISKDDDGDQAHDFVCQIRLSDLRGLPDVGLPTAGLLSFFVLRETGADGWFLSESRVIYTPTGKKLEPRQRPASFGKAPPTAQCEIRLLPTLSLPDLAAIAKKKKLTDDEGTELANFMYGNKSLAKNGVGLRAWQLGGYRCPHEEQKDPMLLQCDSSHADLVWGDQGYLTFFLSRSNLGAKRFDKVWSSYDG